MYAVHSTQIPASLSPSNTQYPQPHTIVVSVSVPYRQPRSWLYKINITGCHILNWINEAWQNITPSLSQPEVIAKMLFGNPMWDNDQPGKICLLSTAGPVRFVAVLILYCPSSGQFVHPLHRTSFRGLMSIYRCGFFYGVLVSWVGSMYVMFSKKWSALIIVGKMGRTF